MNGPSPHLLGEDHLMRKSLQAEALAAHESRDGDPISGGVGAPKIDGGHDDARPPGKRGLRRIFAGR